MTTRSSTCYMCAAGEASREHAPPQCLFPTESEIGKDLRKNLITVPSCDEHNSKKSADDEFMRAVILMAAVSSNDIARHLFLGKFLRGVQRSSHIYSEFFKDPGLLSSGNQLALQLNRDRFDKCIDHIARALFFHTFNAKWDLPIVMASPNFYSEVTQQGPVTHLPTQQAIEATKQFLLSEPVRGENSEVFMYRIRYDKPSKIFAFAGCFYDFFEIYGVSSNALVETHAA